MPAMGRKPSFKAAARCANLTLLTSRATLGFAFLFAAASRLVGDETHFRTNVDSQGPGLAGSAFFHVHDSLYRGGAEPN